MRTKRFMLVGAIGILLLGCESNPKAAHTGPLVVPRKTHFWDNWGKSSTASSKEHPTGTPFKFDGKSK